MPETPPMVSVANSMFCGAGTRCMMASKAARPAAMSPPSPLWGAKNGRSDALAFASASVSGRMEMFAVFFN
jgi:hypothetical protein